MAFKSLSFSVFIVCLCVASEIPGVIQSEQTGMVNKTFGDIESPRAVSLDDLGLDKDTKKVLDKWNITRSPQDELSGDGTLYRIKNFITMIESILIKSTIGFYDFIIQLFRLEDNATAEFIVVLAAVFVNLNHLIALGQLLGLDWGGKV